MMGGRSRVYIVQCLGGRLLPTEKLLVLHSCSEQYVGPIPLPPLRVILGLPLAFLFHPAHVELGQREFLVQGRRSLRQTGKHSLFCCLKARIALHHAMLLQIYARNSLWCSRLSRTHDYNYPAPASASSIGIRGYLQ